MRYPGAIPTLVHWLPRIADRRVKEDIVRTLVGPVGEATGNAGSDRGIPGTARV